MTLDEYQQQASRTASFDDGRFHMELAVLGLGIAGEAGEVADILKKYVGHGHALDYDKLTKELGDTLWYISQIAALCGLSLEYVAHKNIDKLAKRYPEGFSHEASRNRAADDQ